MVPPVGWREQLPVARQQHRRSEWRRRWSRNLSGREYGVHGLRRGLRWLLQRRQDWHADQHRIGCRRDAGVARLQDSESNAPDFYEWCVHREYLVCRRHAEHRCESGSQRIGGDDLVTVRHGGQWHWRTSGHGRLGYRAHHEVGPCGDHRERRGAEPAEQRYRQFCGYPFLRRCGGAGWGNGGGHVYLSRHGRGGLGETELRRGDELRIATLSDPHAPGTFNLTMILCVAICGRCKKVKSLRDTNLKDIRQPLSVRPSVHSF
ncbi:hypothetical protein PCAR4_1360040 [Paraburkholderia caribensis]|nr:hypothetical protein PCAR4_1360040 [Paraburkholderia caribensis]